jgi:hypothetical protein
MAALLLQPYSSSAFNTLPSLHDANAEFKERNAAELMNSILAGIFIKHNVEGRLGVQLLHRHFSLRSDERLVDVGNASVPWSNVGSEALDSCIIPASWAFEGDSYHPYEFKFIPPNQAGGSQELKELTIQEPFLVEFNEALKAHHLQGILGIRALKGDCKKPELEITNGRSNITFEYDSDAAEEDKAIEASWVFDGSGTPTTLGRCSSYCSPCSGDNHNQYHDVSALQNQKLGFFHANGNLSITSDPSLLLRRHSSRSLRLCVPSLMSWMT